MKGKDVTVKHTGDRNKCVGSTYNSKYRDDIPDASQVAMSMRKGCQTYQILGQFPKCNDIGVKPEMSGEAAQKKAGG